VFGSDKRFHPSLMFASKVKSFPKRGETESCSTWVGSRPYPQKLDLGGKACQDKHSSLLRTFVNYGRKKFYNIGPETNVIKRFYHNLRIFWRNLSKGMKSVHNYTENGLKE
jgi:hypothetical protein